MPNNLALNVSLGAFVHNSMGKAFKDATKSSKKLGKSFAEVNDKLRTADNVDKFRKQLDRLKREQAETGDSSGKLAARIKRTQSQLSSAEFQAKEYGLSLGDITREQKRLSKESTRYNKILKRREKLGKMGSAIRGGARKVAGIGALAGGFSIGGAFAAITGANRQTAVNDRQAAAVGVDPKTMQALGGVVKGLGFEAENVNDLFEELNNKMGESAGLGEVTAATEALQMLGLEYDYLATLDPEKQFLEIARAAQKMGDATQASAAADILMSGEANRIFGDLVRRGVAIDDLVAKQKSLIVLTKEGRAGAGLFNTAMNNLSMAAGTAFQEISGLVGSELSGTIEGWSKSIVSTFRDNREEIMRFVAGIGPLLEGLPGKMKAAFDMVGRIARGLDTVLGFFGGDDETPAEKARAQYNPREPGQNYGTRNPHSYGQYQQASTTVSKAEAAQKTVKAAQTGNTTATTAPVVNLTVNNAQNMDEAKLAAEVQSKINQALIDQQRRVDMQLRSGMYDQ